MLSWLLTMYEEAQKQTQEIDTHKFAEFGAEVFQAIYDNRFNGQTDEVTATKINMLVDILVLDATIEEEEESNGN